MSYTNIGPLYCLGGATWETEEQLFSSFSTNCHFRLQSNDVEMVVLGNGLEYDQTFLSCCVFRKVLVIPFYQPSCLTGTPKPPSVIYEKSEENGIISEVKTDTELKCDETFLALGCSGRDFDQGHVSCAKCNICGAKSPHTHENGEVTILRQSKKTTKQGSSTVHASEMDRFSKEEKYEMESEHFSDLDQNENILDSESETSKIIKCFRKRPVLKERDFNENNRNHPYDKELNNIIDYDSGYEIEIVIESVENVGPEQPYVDYFSDLKHRRRDLKKRNEAMMTNSYSHRDFVVRGDDDDDDDDSSKDVNLENNKNDSRYGFDDTPDEETSSTGESLKVQSCRNVTKTRRKRRRKSITFEYHERKRRSKRCAAKVQR